MIAVIQRVAHASLTVEGVKVAECGVGLLILLGVAKDDTEYDASLLSDKISKLRIFQDDNGKMNLSVNDVSGSCVVVPNFTLLASCRKGNRPDFFGSAEPPVAKELFEKFTSFISEAVPGVTSGIFGADMKVDLLNDGPVTIVIDSADLRKNKSI